ncbi:hypothetical protein TVAG_173130 [Trichomonas vaginalis G3]|uniref:Uncharacterized protein n=1 Tax=Trichomonas vaginalis (strain ATCC PRA-98 / G3) TaxID=412133 RepID=A2DF63_TRIV3|nr:hypothetical protein TVAG_173130 [Trichomonas vaginalis G3]|eukprot:XP_001582041.1 hypothetical protein [Trichomonas vaginalis G3]
MYTNSNSNKAIRNMIGEIKIPGKSAIPTITKSIEKFSHYVVDDMVRASEFLVMCHE